ncbi:RNB domain-containing ribonuclease [Jatrophihabitans sp. DSM 45814]
MGQRRLAGTPLDFASLRVELELPGEFSSAVLAQARSAASKPADRRLDRTDIELITVDPAGSKDLDQALHIIAESDGYLVSYAIADVSFFVDPQSPLDLETRVRGESYYFPDARVPLHPFELSEGAASLLPGQVRPAVLWQIHLDQKGNVTEAAVERALVKSREQWDYAALQRACDDGTPPAAASLLPAVGALRQTLARERHAIALNLPEQEVRKDDLAAGSSWELVLRAPLPIEEANAEISLLTGMCAAQIMLSGGVGILRTLPPPTEATISALRRIAPALGIDWPTSMLPGEVLVRLDRTNPKHAAFLDQASSLLRGAAYTGFDGTPPKQQYHAGIGAPYAHVTAPLRRLVDRFGTEICLALQARSEIPDWARSALEALPSEMASADRRAHLVDRAVVDATEAFLLEGRVGEEFEAVVIDAGATSATIAIEQPAIRARCDGLNLPLGDRLKVRLESVDTDTRTVRFAAP